MIAPGKNISRAVLAAAGLAAAVSVLTGCSQDSVSCHGKSSCDVSVSGNIGVDLGIDKVPGHPDKTYAGEHGFEIVGYDANDVRVNADQQDYTVHVGETKRVARVAIRVISVKGETAKLHVNAV